MALIWSGQVLSQMGTRMYQIALMWWVVSEGGGGKEAGVFMVMGALPALLLLRVIGRVVERSPRRTLLVGCDLASAAIVAGVGAALASGSLGLHGAYAAGFLVAASQGFFDPALNKSLSELIPAQDMEEAVALQSTTQSLASFGGAALGALLIDRLGVLGVVWLNAASFLASAALNALLRFPAPAAAPPAEAESAGWELLRDLPWVRKALLGFGLANFFLTPVLLVMPLYVRALGAGASMLGLLEAGLWLGLLLGAALAGRVRVESAAALGSGCLAVAALCLIVPGLLVGAPAFVAALLVLGAAMGVNNVKFVALFQELVPAERKGRFFALMQAILTFTFPASFFLFGLLADALTPARVLIVQGLGVLALAGWFLSLAGEAAPRAAAGESHAG